MTPLTLETYALILARLACRRGAAVGEILAELGITAEDFAREEPDLCLQLREAWTRRKGVAAMKFAAAMGEELESLKRPSLGASFQALQAPAVPDPVVQVPSALLDPPTGEGPSRWAAQAPSYVTADPRAAATPPRWSDTPGPAAGVVPAPRPPAPEAPAPVVAPPAPKLPLSLSSTLPLGTDLPVVVTLPFSAAPASSPTPLELAATARPEAPSVRVRSGTLAIGDEAAPPPLPPGVVDLTLPQYASLRVDLQTAPERTAATLSRYGVSPDAREALDAYWRARFEADPLLRMMFARAYAAYVTWLKANPPPRGP